MIGGFAGFNRVVALDTEFTVRDGGLLTPICIVAHELISGERIRWWFDELGSGPPFPTDDTTLHVTFMAAAEINFYLACGWPAPTRVLDLFVEFRNHTNVALPKNLRQQGASLLSALKRFEIHGIHGVEKKEMQNLAIRGAPFTEQEKQALLDYCESDVLALPPLMERLLTHIRARRKAPA